MLRWHQAAVAELLLNRALVRITTSLLGVILVARTSHSTGPKDSAAERHPCHSCVTRHLLDTSSM